MSVTATIEIKIQNDKELDIEELLSILIEGGWKLFRDGKVRYLPLGDDDDFDWQENTMSQNDIFELIKQKKSHNEIIAFALYWDESDVGGDVMILSDNTISFNANINRKIIEISKGNSITDVSWYLETFVGVLKNANFQLISFSFEEY